MTNFSKACLHSVFKYLRNFPEYILKYLQLQLFITIVSLPILIMWGLPISLASPLGNFIFNPFLMVFLLLSSLIFFCEVCYIPNYYLIVLLEYFNSFWLYIISTAKRSWLVAIAQPPLVILLLLLLITFAALHHKKLLKTYLSVISLLIIICITISGGYYFSKLNARIAHISCFDKELTFISAKNCNLLIDPGVFRRVSAPSYITFTLIPQLIRTHGVKSIDHVICLKPCNLSFQALAALINKVEVKYLYLPNWNGQLNNSALMAWQNFLETIKKFDTQLIFINSEEYTIELSENDKITFTAQEKPIKKNKLSYPEISINGLIDGSLISIKSL